MVGGELSELLPADHRRALSSAIPVLIDDLLEDLAALQRGDSFADTVMADYLPPKYLHRYDLLFAKRFVACVYAAGWKLLSPDAQSLACVGEELALHALIQTAEVILDLNGTQAEFGALYEAAFEDDDYALLFDPW